MVVLFLAFPVCILAFVPVFIAHRRRCRYLPLIAAAVVISLALLPISIIYGGISSLRIKGFSELLLWWSPAGLLWLVALLCSCLGKNNNVQRGFDILPVHANPLAANGNVRPPTASV